MSQDYNFLVNKLFNIYYDNKYRTYFTFRETFNKAKHVLNNDDFNNLLNDIFNILNINNYNVCKKNDKNQINIIKFSSYIYDNHQKSVCLIYDTINNYMVKYKNKIITDEDIMKERFKNIYDKIIFLEFETKYILNNCKNELNDNEYQELIGNNKTTICKNIYNDFLNLKCKDNIQLNYEKLSEFLYSKHQTTTSNI